MRRVCFLLPLALAACHPGEASGGGAANVTSNGAPSDQGAFLTPGRWTLTKTFKDKTSPSSSPSELAEQRRLLAGMPPETAEFCLTPELAKRPPANFFIGNGAVDCGYESLDHRGGKVTAKLTCHIPTMTETDQVTTAGTFDPGSVHLEETLAQSMAGMQPHGTTILTLEGKNTGACTGHEGQP